MGKMLKLTMFVTDIGFVAYWLIVLLELLPKDYLYQDYDNELMTAWNLSFLPLDLFISITGLTSIYLYSKKPQWGRSLCIISLALTFCSGLQAIAFWAIRGDFDIWWWLPNGFLLLYPLLFLPRLIRFTAQSQQPDSGNIQRGASV